MAVWGFYNGILHVYCYYYSLFQDYEVLYMEKFITAFLQDLLKFIRQAFIQLCIYAFTYLFICSFIHLFIYFLHPCIHSLISCIQPYLHLFILSYIQWCIFILYFFWIYWLACSFIVVNLLYHSCILHSYVFLYTIQFHSYLFWIVIIILFIFIINTNTFDKLKIIFNI